MIDLSKKEDREELAYQIETDINNYCSAAYDDGHRTHLGASIMGEECLRKLFYTFRWVKHVVYEGRMQRLFQVGHEAEPRFAKYLTALGFEVSRINPDTNKQWRMESLNGHYGGSLDAKIKAPAKYEISEDLIFLGEFKTNNTGSGFTAVVDKGMRIAKPKHFAQASQYGLHYGLKYALYLIENKNDSNLTVEIVPLDWNLGRQLEQKAENIILAKYPPNKINENPVYWECKFCDFNAICHHGEKVEKNCRSCRHARPIEAAQWFCDRHTAIIPKDFIPKGCDDHVSVNGE